MAQFAIMAGRAILNAGAFSRINSFFSMLFGREVESCNKSLAQLQIDKEKWVECRAQLADLANEELQRQGHALQSFKHADKTLEEYHSLINIDLHDSLGPEPKLENYYQPIQDIKMWELIGIGTGMPITALIACHYNKSN